MSRFTMLEYDTSMNFMSELFFSRSVIYTGESSDVRVTLENRNAEVIENQVMRHHFDINAPLSQTPFRRVFPDT